MLQAPPRRLRALAIAALIALALLVWGRQITLQRWHAGHGDYRAQVAAFLEGRLDLDDAPEAARHDLAWTGDGVQQVWGLGVPAWQTPFELVGRAVGWTPFPDRVALLVFLALVIFVSIRGWVRSDEPWWIGAGAVAITALSPAFVTLVRSRLGVYEEAAVYAYGTAILLLGGCACLARRTSRARYLALVGFAGLVGFIRPTVWCYGVATLVVASALHRRAIDIAIGAALFVAGGSLLYATNAHRFGNGLEFGHRLNLQGLSGNLFATRFSYPFERVRLSTASEELVGALFDSPERNEPEHHPGSSFYEKHLHRGQADLPRWREYYFSTFNWGYVPLLGAGLVLGARAWRRRDGPSGGGERWLLAWAILGGAPLAWYYLRAPFFSSRYALDLGPAFAALIVIAWRAVAASRRGALVASVLAAAWASNVALAHVSRRGPTAVPSAVARIASDSLSHATAYAHPLPAAYDLDDPWLPTYVDWLEAFDRCWNADGSRVDPDDLPVAGDSCLHGELVHDDGGGAHWLVWQSQVGDGELRAPECELPRPEPVCRAEPSAANGGEVVAAFISPPCLYLNMVRWDLATGQVPPATYAWIDDPEFVELDVSTLDGAPADWARNVQVEIAGRRLALVAVTDTPRGVRLRFEAPTHDLPRGLQVAFFAFGPDTELDRATTRFAVHSIRWRAR
jgi:hypothetical protein